MLVRLYHLPWKSQVPIPIFATAFGDLIVLEARDSVATLQFRNSIFRSSALKYYLADIPDEYFRRDVLGIRGYKAARKRLPIPKYGDCYAYDPLVCQGGPERADHLRISNMRAYLKEMIAVGYQLNENNIRFVQLD